MNYFIYKVEAGVVRPQAGYEQVSISPLTDTWVLVQTMNEVATIQALPITNLKIVGVDPDAEILAVYPGLVDQLAEGFRAQGSENLTNLAGAYNSEERETWHVQKAEALAFAADPAADTPMLTAMATQRGITVADMAGLVAENIAAFEVASGVILGKQQKALFDLYTAADLVAAFAVEYPA